MLMRLFIRLDKSHLNTRAPGKENVEELWKIVWEGVILILMDLGQKLFQSCYSKVLKNPSNTRKLPRVMYCHSANKIFCHLA